MSVISSMASTSALRLDISIVSNSTTSSPSTSTSYTDPIHPRIPPRSQWPLDTDLDETEDQGWGSVSQNGSTGWITATSSWRQDDEGHKTTTTQGVPHRRCAYLAVGMLDGSTWIFREDDDQGDRRQSRPASSTPASPQNDTSNSPSFSAPRPTSPASSVHSQASRTTVTSAVPQPPFAGFHQANDSSGMLSPVSPALGVTAESSSAGSSSLIRTGETKQSATGQNSARGSSTALDTLESRLEAQYHSGSNKESGITQMMDALGISRHSHPPSHHHPSSSSSPARAKKSSSKTSPAPSERGSSQSPSPEMSRTPSQSGLTSAAPVGRRHAHSRTQALMNGLPGSHSLGSISMGSTAERRKRSGSGGSNRSSLYGGTVGPIYPVESAEERPPLPEQRTRELRSFNPLFRITSADKSPVSTARSVRLGAKTCLLLLHQSGLLSLWSLDDSIVLTSIDLASSSSYLPPGQSETSTAVPGHTSSSGLTASLPGPLANLAALRSVSNSPAPTKAGFLSLPSSRPASRGPSGPSVGAAGAIPSTGEAPYSHHGRFVDLQVIQGQDGEILVGCYDAIKKRSIFLEVKRHKASGKTNFTLLGSLDLGEVSSTPSLMLSRSPLVAQVTHQTKDGKTLVLHEISLVSLKKPLAAAPRKQLPLPLLEGQAFVCTWLVWENVLLGYSSQWVAIMRRQDDALIIAASITLAGVSKVQSLPGIGGTTTRWAAIYSQAGTHLLEVISNPDHTELTLALTEISRLDEEDTLTAIAKEEDVDAAPDVVAVKIDESERLLIAKGDLEQQLTLYRSPQDGEVKVLQVLPLSMERIITVLSNGQVHSLSFSQLLSFSSSTLPDAQNAPQTTAPLTLLTSLSRPRAQSRIIMGGFESGDVAFWDATTLSLITEWSLFTTRIVKFAQFGKDDNTLRLHGCIALSAQDGTVAVILLDGLKLLYLIPGRGIPLERIAVRADEILLLYGDERARVWDMATMELRRSIGVEQALSLLDDGAGSWTQHPFMGKEAFTGSSSSSGVLSAAIANCGEYPTLTADLKKAIEAAAKAVHVSSGVERGPTATEPLRNTSSSSDTDAFNPLRPQPTRPGIPAKGKGKRALSILRPILAALWPRGREDRIDKVMDDLLDEVLGASTSMIFGIPSDEQSHILHLRTGTIPPSIETSRTLAVLAMLQVLSQDGQVGTRCEELADWVVNSTTQISLPLLAPHLVDSTDELKSAAKRLFEEGLAKLSGEVVEDLCAEWKLLLPTRQIPSSLLSASSSSSFSESSSSAVALSLLGFIGVSCYKSLDPALLKDIATSLSLSLAIDSPPILQNIALELCLAGFSTWQPYLDAMDLLRRIFRLAMSPNNDTTGASISTKTSSTTSSLSTTGIRNLARRTTLHVAEENTPLFMTTLHLDILQASTATQANATMNLVAYIIRRNPLVLYANLPRLTEAVVKSLDPTSPLRESVLSSATLMIFELISTYPCVDFHNRLQRLAIGTQEGAIILYDLKTATRLFILEGHARSVDAVSFSPNDGRRLLSVSLKEGRCLGWKVGSSLAGFFAPGVMPRQGGNEGTGGAYRCVYFQDQLRTELSPARGGMGGGNSMATLTSSSSSSTSPSKGFTTTTSSSNTNTSTVLPSSSKEEEEEEEEQQPDETRKKANPEKTRRLDLEIIPKISFDWKSDRVGILEIHVDERITRIPFNVS